MGPFEKYMIFGTNFMRSENQLLMWKVIYFSCTLKSVAYFVPRLPSGLIIFQNYLFCFFFLLYPPFTSPSLSSETSRQFADVIIEHHLHLSSVDNLSLSPFPFPLSLSFLPFWYHQERERGKGKGERRRLPTGESCERGPMMKSTKCMQWHWFLCFTNTQTNLIFENKLLDWQNPFDWGENVGKNRTKVNWDFVVLHFFIIKLNP